MELNLKGKNAIVTGGAHDLGRAICLKLTEEGANIALNYNSSAERAQRTLKDIRALGVNAAAPGMMYTDMTADVLDREREKYDKQIPLGRIGDVEETARMAAFLLNDAASYTTGATIGVTGGMMGR
jgi:NAD(P)-dependent dehydrogenase (short-subunit alcohol dehydrogenase family)